MTMLPYDINVSTISWIDKELMSVFSDISTLKSALKGDWVDLLGFGMYHTANPKPPAIFHGQKYASGKTLEKQYRSLTSYSIQLQTDTDGKFVAVRRLPGSDAVLDAGYTPPFDSGWEMWKGVIGYAALQYDPTLPSLIHSEASSYNPGEKSSLSQTVLPGTEWQNKGITPLAYSSIKVNGDEVILGHSLIKFRVGGRGNYIAVVAIGTPAHMP